MLLKQADSFCLQLFVSFFRISNKVNPFEVMSLLWLSALRLFRRSNGILTSYFRSFFLKKSWKACQTSSIKRNSSFITLKYFREKDPFNSLFESSLWCNSCFTGTTTFLTRFWILQKMRFSCLAGAEAKRMERKLLWISSIAIQILFGGSHFFLYYF